MYECVDIHIDVYVLLRVLMYKSVYIYVCAHICMHCQEFGYNDVYISVYTCYLETWYSDAQASRLIVRIVG